MKRYLKSSWLVILAYIVFFAGIALNWNQPLHGDVLIPLPLIYFALVLRADKNPKQRGGQVGKTKRISA